MNMKLKKINVRVGTIGFWSFTAALLLAVPAMAQTAANITATPGVMTTFAGTTTNGGGGLGNGGAATSSTLYNPVAARFDGAGNLYILDAGNMVIRKVIGTGQTGAGTIVAFAGTGVAGNGGDGGQASGASFSATARGLFVTSAGVIYISDSGNNAIRRIDATGKIATVAGTNGAAAAYTGDGGPATAATLNNPGGIYLDASGNLYIADTGNNVVRVVNASGVISTFAGGTASVCPKAADAQGDGCPFLQTNFNTPSDVWGDAAGNLDIMDSGNFRVRKAVASSGLVISIVGTGIKGASDNATATGGTIGGGLSGITIDSTGNLYIADTGNSKVRIVTLAGALVSVAGNGTAGFAGDGNSATTAFLNLPQGVTLDASENIYISDTQNSRIREVLVNAGILNLASQAVTVASTTASVETFQNNGTAPLLFTAITVTAPFVEKTGVSTDCKVGTAVAVGGTCTLSILYTPTTAGFVTGTATLQSNAANAPSGATVITLNGEAVSAGTLASTTTFTFSNLTIPTATQGQSVTLAVTVTGGTSAYVPTGTVQLNSGAIVLGTATLAASMSTVNSSVATLTTTTLPVGFDAVTVTYLGDTNYKTSVSAVQTIDVSAGTMDFGFSATPTTITIPNGSSGTVVLNLYSINGYGGLVGFQCPNLPAGATCTFVPFTAYLAPGKQSVPNIAVTLGFPPPIGAENHPYAPWKPTSELAFAAMLFGATLFRKRGCAAILPVVLVGCSVFGFASLSGCSSNPTQASLAGTHNIQIVASDGTVSHTVTIAVTVQ